MHTFIIKWRRFVHRANTTESILRSHGGQLRMSEAIACGISRYQLYALKRQGVIEQVSRATGVVDVDGSLLSLAPHG
jgi:hypothetical protein